MIEALVWVLTFSFSAVGRATAAAMIVKKEMMEVRIVKVGNWSCLVVDNDGRDVRRDGSEIW